MSAITAKQQQIAHLFEVLDRLYLQMRLGSTEDWPQVELTMPQLRTLFLLHVSGPLNMTELASYLEVGLPSATSMVDRLVEKGLVERGPDPEDRRVVACRLTEVGRQEAEKFWRLRRESIDRIVQTLSTEEMETLVTALDIVVGRMQEEAGRKGCEQQSEA